MGFTSAVGIGAVGMDSGSILERHATGVLQCAARQLGCRTTQTAVRMGTGEVVGMVDYPTAHNQRTQAAGSD